MNERLATILIDEKASIRQAMEVIDAGGVEIALMADGNRRLVGTLSDGDIRRALLAGASLDDRAAPHVARQPLVVSVASQRSEVLELMRSTGKPQVPVLDEDGRIVGLLVMQEVLGSPLYRSLTTHVPLAVPMLGGNESRYVEECIETNFVSSVGPFVDRFEVEFAAAVGAQHAVACASGTAALHIAMVILGVGRGDVVAVPSFTFIASANAIVYTGASPLFIDSEPLTWNMDASMLYDEVQRRARSGEQLPAAIEVVHVLGHPAEVEPLLALRAELGIPIVEDAAEALGARYLGGPAAGRQVGTVGDIGCFSFNGNKVITTGGGGMIVTDDESLARRARHLTTQAKVPGPGYEHDEIGFNYRMSNVAAAIGVAQLEQLDVFLEAKRRLARTYDESLADLPVSLPPRQPWAESTFWLYSPLLEEASPDVVVSELVAEGIQARPLWPPLHRQRPYAGHPVVGGAVSEDIYRRGISLPSSTSISGGEQLAVVTELRRVLGS